MHKITALALFVLVASASACSSGGRTGFVGDAAVPSESAADVSNPMTTEEVVEAIKEDIVAHETEVEVPVVPTDEIAGVPNVDATPSIPETPGEEEAPSQPTSADLPEEATADEPPSTSAADAPSSVSIGIADTVITPADHGTVSAGGKPETNINDTISIDRPYIPPKQTFNTDVSISEYHNATPEKNELPFRRIDCGVLKTINCP